MKKEWKNFPETKLKILSRKLTGRSVWKSPFMSQEWRRLDSMSNS